MKSQQSERREFSRTVVVDEELHLVLRRPDVESVYSELETERIRCGNENQAASPPAPREQGCVYDDVETRTVRWRGSLEHAVTLCRLSGPSRTYRVRQQSKQGRSRLLKSGPAM